MGHGDKYQPASRHWFLTNQTICLGATTVRPLFLSCPGMSANGCGFNRLTRLIWLSLFWVYHVSVYQITMR